MDGLIDKMNCDPENEEEINVPVVTRKKAVTDQFK